MAAEPCAYSTLFSDFTWEPYDNFGDYKKLADDFKAQWEASQKPWPPAAPSLSLATPP